MGSRRGGAQQGLELGEGRFDGIEVGAVGRQVSQARAGGLDRLFDAMDLVSGQIVHDDDVAWSQLGNERLFDIGEKGLAKRNFPSGLGNAATGGAPTRSIHP